VDENTTFKKVGEKPEAGRTGTAIFFIIIGFIIWVPSLLTFEFAAIAPDEGGKVFWVAVFVVWTIVCFVFVIRGMTDSMKSTVPVHEADGRRFECRHCGYVWYDSYVA
jgi:hypothetical protein